PRCRAAQVRDQAVREGRHRGRYPRAGRVRHQQLALATNLMKENCTMTSRTLRALAVLGCSVVLATTFAGCGSSDKNDDSKSDSSRALTDTEFRDQANAICKAADADENSTFSQMQTALNSQDQASADAAARAGAKVIRAESDKIAALKAPKDLQSDVDALV